jgi:putative transferase (TIGR04331 family)
LSKKIILVTTADERSWLRDKPTLFLGEWCRLYDRRHIWEKLDAQVLTYHWDNRRKYFLDYAYLKEVNEAILEKLVRALNTKHCTNYSKRYWRILIGPWLFQFIHILFDRWESIQNATDQFEIANSLLIKFPINNLIPFELSDMIPDSIQWNHYLYGEIIKFQNNFPWTEIDPIAVEKSQKLSDRYNENIFKKINRMPAKWPSISRWSKSVLSKLLGKLSTSTESFIFQSCISRFQEFKLHLALGQLPKLWYQPNINYIEPDCSQRSLFTLEGDGFDDFMDFTCSMIPKQIPIVYLEGYKNLIDAVDNLNWPSKPKLIFTSNAFYYNEVFQAWTAKNVEKGVPLIIGQHGGMYGTGKWVAGEDFQIEIADRFLTWGWNDERAETYPNIALTSIGKKKAVQDTEGYLLLVTTPVRVVSFKCTTWPVGPTQAVNHINDHIKFTQNLNRDIHINMILRVFRKADENTFSFFYERWSNEFPEIKVDDSTKPIEKMILNCRLFVYGFNGTGYLETMLRNIPTVIFWSPSNWELRDSAKPYFQLLQEVGIFHETPESAAQHVLKVWGDVSSWWEDPHLQTVRKQFCDQYARMSNSPILDLKKAITTVKSTYK